MEQNQSTQARPMQASLYERLGGAEGIRAIVDGVVGAHMKNPVIKARFLPYASKSERLAELKQHLCAFLAMGSGGPHRYAGRSMPDAHRGMNISAAEYMAAVDDIMAVLRARSIDAPTQNEVLGIAYSLKDDIVHV
jgi:hemoglobin